MTDVSINLIPILGILATIAGVLFWRMFTRLENKMDIWMKQHLECRERQHQEFVKITDFDQWKTGRKDIYARIHGHKHDKDGKVVITEGIK